MILVFPFKGLDKGRATGQQRVGRRRPAVVGPYDTLDNRARGGQRPGLDKLYTEQISGEAAAIMAICSVTVIN